MVSSSPSDTTTMTISNTRTRTTWYDDVDDDEEKDDDVFSSSSSTFPSRTKEDVTPCWGGWLLKLTTHRIQTQQRSQRVSKDAFAMVRKPSLKVVTSASSATSDDSELGLHDDEDDHDSSSDERRCRSRSMTPPCPPSVSFPRHHSEEEDEDEEDDDTWNDEIRMIRDLETKGERCEHDGLFDDALLVYQKLLELLRVTGQSSHQIAIVHYRNGIIQYQLHCYNEALCHFDQALFIYQLNYNPDHELVNEEEEEDSMTLDFYRVYVATGHVHLTNQNPYRAIDYFHRALQFVEINNKPSLESPSKSSSSSLTQHEMYYAQVLQALGTAYEAVGDDTEAKLHYNKAAVVLGTTTNS